MCHLEQDIRSPSETPPVPAPHHHAIPPLHQEPSLPSWNLKMVKVESCSCLLRMGGRPSAISKANQRYQPHTMAMQYHDEEGREYLKKMFGDIVAAYFWGCSSLWWWSNQQAPKKKNVLLTLYLFRYHYISFRMATHWLRPCKNWGPNSGTPWRHQSKHGQNNVMHRSLDLTCFGRGMYNTTTSAWWNYMTRPLGNKCAGIVCHWMFEPMTTKLYMDTNWLKWSPWLLTFAQTLPSRTWTTCKACFGWLGQKRT